MDRKAQILVVDDIPQNVRLLHDILVSKGYSVVTASNGEEGLSLLHSHPIDLCLLDVVMPGINGFEVCQKIRATPAHAMLPVVLVTALDASEDRVKGIEAGADDFLTKPVNMYELLARVKSLLRIHELFETVQRQARELEHWNHTLEEKVHKQVQELERLGRLRRFLSPQVADLVVSSGDDHLLRSHRQQIATLFCDLRGFTHFSEEAEPEEAMDILRQYHEEMGTLIYRKGGTIEHRAGDGIMVIFNDPVPCEHPVDTALTLALEMRGRMGQLTQGWTQLGFELGFGVGLTVGYATLGMVGHEGRSDYTANGNCVNLAARLCDEAEDGQVLVTEKVLAMIDVEVDTEPLEPRALKGVLNPVVPHNVIGVRLETVS